MTTIHFTADAVARSRQLEMHQRTARMTNQVMDEVRGRVRDLRIVTRIDGLELHGVCRTVSDASAVIESAQRVMGTATRISNLVEVIE